MASHAEGLRKLAETLMHLAKAKEATDAMSNENQYGEEFQQRAAVARASVNDAFDTVRLGIEAVRQHEQERIAVQLKQTVLFGDGAEGGDSGTIPPPDDSDAHSDGGAASSKGRKRKAAQDPAQEPADA